MSRAHLTATAIFKYCSSGPEEIPIKGYDGTLQSLMEYFGTTFYQKEPKKIVVGGYDVYGWTLEVDVAFVVTKKDTDEIVQVEVWDLNESVESFIWYDGVQIAETIRCAEWEEGKPLIEIVIGGDRQILFTCNQDVH